MFSLEHSKFETSLGYPHVLHRSAVRYNVWCSEEKPDINMGIYLYINIYIYKFMYMYILIMQMVIKIY